MYGSFGEAKENFRGGKKKDNEKSKRNQECKDRRQRRQHRHDD